MPKVGKGLSAVAVKSAGPGRHVDRDGLLLEVKPSGSATWVFRYALKGKRRDMGLGRARGHRPVTLAEARDKVAELRKLLAQGLDPIDHRKAQAAAEAAARHAREVADERRAINFRTASIAYIENHRAGWTNAKHADAWYSTLEAYAYSVMGVVPVAEVDTRHVEGVLRPIWATKTETASRLRGRIELILDYARVQGWRPEHISNPARWRGHLDKIFPRPSKVAPVEHHAALHWRDIPAFLPELRARDALAARALELCILTATRSDEVISARWFEFNLENAVWEIPDRRTKSRQPHRVPLSDQALAILREVRDLATGPSAYVFPGQRENRPLSNMAMLTVLRRMNGRGKTTPKWVDSKTGEAITVHGFRSTFKDWCAEAGRIADDISEAALAHAVGGKTKAAYARGDLFDRRREAMDAWASYCTRNPTQVTDPALVHLRLKVGA